MYFNDGSYPALNTAGTGAITLNTGQSVSSRSIDYSAPATDTARSTFNGAFILNSNNVLNSIILLTTPATASGNGVTITGDSDDVITGNQIGSSNLYTTGVMIDSTQLATNNSMIFDVNRGVRAQNFSTLSIQGSQINAIHTIGGTTEISLSHSTLVFDDSQIFSQAPGSVNGSSTGINALSGSTARIINGSTITAVQTGVTNSAFGLQTDTNSSQQMIGGTLSVMGTSTALTMGPNIMLSGVTCLINGVPTAC